PRPKGRCWASCVDDLRGWPRTRVTIPDASRHAMVVVPDRRAPDGGPGPLRRGFRDVAARLHLPRNAGKPVGEGDREGVEDPLAEHRPRCPSSIGRIKRSDDEVEPFQGGLFGGEVAAGFAGEATRGIEPLYRALQVEPMDAFAQVDTYFGCQL